MDLDGPDQFLGLAHWDAICAPSLPNAAASELWQQGAAAFARSLNNADSEQERLRAVAEGAWQAALVKDPGLTDGWVGLVLVERVRGQSGLELSRALAHSAHRLGEEQRRHRSPLALDYSLLFSSHFTVSLPDDLRLLHAAACMRAGEDDEALYWVQQCQAESLRTTAALASLALRAHRWRQALPHARRLALGDTPQLALDGLISSGIALTALGRRQEAQVALEQALTRASSPTSKVAARYALSRVYRARGDSIRELAELELLERDDPDFADVPKRLDALREEDPEGAWWQIVAGLSGPLADEPDILDNSL
jgi:tetratricopeptide (TPR) repeat protein